MRKNCSVLLNSPHTLFIICFIIFTKPNNENLFGLSYYGVSDKVYTEQKLSGAKEFYIK